MRTRMLVLALAITAAAPLTACGSAGDQAPQEAATTARAVATLPPAGGAAGGDVVGDAATVARDDSSTTAATSPPTTAADDQAPPASVDDDDREKARKISQRFLDKYHGALVAFYQSFGQPWDGKADVQDAIEDACKANDDGYSEDMGMAAVMITGFLTNEHQNWADFSADLAKVNRDIRKLGVCS